MCSSSGDQINTLKEMKCAEQNNKTEQRTHLDRSAKVQCMFEARGPIALGLREPKMCTG